MATLTDTVQPQVFDLLIKRSDRLTQVVNHYASNHTDVVLGVRCWEDGKYVGPAVSEPMLFLNGDLRPEIIGALVRATWETRTSDPDVYGLVIGATETCLKLVVKANRQGLTEILRVPFKTSARSWSPKIHILAMADELRSLERQFATLNDTAQPLANVLGNADATLMRKVKAEQGARLAVEEARAKARRFAEDQILRQYAEDINKMAEKAALDTAKACLAQKVPVSYVSFAKKQEVDGEANNTYVYAVEVGSEAVFVATVLDAVQVAQPTIAIGGQQEAVHPASRSSWFSVNWTAAQKRPWNIFDPEDIRPQWELPPNERLDKWLDDWVVTVSTP